jgi:hypothetical protein
VCAFGVVGGQDLANEDEEVVEPAGAECGFDSDCPLALAEVIILDVRMRHVLAVPRVVRLLGMAAIAVRIADLLPEEHDPKCAQLDAFQLHVGRYGADRMGFEIDLDVFELVFQGHQVSSHFTGRSDRTGSGPRREALPQHVDFPLQAAGRVIRVREERLTGRMPVFILGIAVPLDRSTKVFPGRLR